MVRERKKDGITRFEVQGKDLRACECGAFYAWVKVGEKWRPSLVYWTVDRWIANTEHPHPPRVCEAQAAALEPEAPGSNTPLPEAEWKMAEWRAWARQEITRI